MTITMNDLVYVAVLGVALYFLFVLLQHLRREWCFKILPSDEDAMRTSTQSLKLEIMKIFRSSYLREGQKLSPDDVFRRLMVRDTDGPQLVLVDVSIERVERALRDLGFERRLIASNEQRRVRAAKPNEVVVRDVPLYQLLQNEQYKQTKGWL